MPTATRGIVLQCIDFSDTSVVVKIYTEIRGIESYLVPGVRTKRSKIKANVFQPLSLLDMVVHHKPGRGLQRISEIKPNPVFQHIPYDILRTSLALFINEILLKTIREEESNSDLFEFLFHAIHFLDLAENTPANFHISFILKLSKYLGCPPVESEKDTHGCFDLTEGTFGHAESGDPLRMNNSQSKLLKLFMKNSFEESEEIKMNRSERSSMVNHLINYLEIHLGHIGQIKSKAILEEILN